MDTLKIICRGISIAKTQLYVIEQTCPEQRIRAKLRLTIKAPEVGCSGRVYLYIIYIYIYEYVYVHSHTMAVEVQSLYINKMTHATFAWA